MLTGCLLERLQIAPRCLVDEEVTLQEVAGLVCAVASLAERGAAQRRYHVHRAAGSMSTSTRSEVGARLPFSVNARAHAHRWRRRRRRRRGITDEEEAEEEGIEQKEEEEE